MERESSFVFYRSFKEAIDNCQEEDRLAIYESIVSYALDGTPPEITGGVIGIVWPLIEPQLNANRDKRKAGRKGGAPRKTNGFDNGITTGCPSVITSGSHSREPNVNENENENGAHKVITSFDQVPR